MYKFKYKTKFIFNNTEKMFDCHIEIKPVPNSGYFLCNGYILANPKIKIEVDNISDWEIASIMRNQNVSTIDSRFKKSYHTFHSDKIEYNIEKIKISVINEKHIDRYFNVAYLTLYDGIDNIRTEIGFKDLPNYNEEKVWIEDFKYNSIRLFTINGDLYFSSDFFSYDFTIIDNELKLNKPIKITDEFLCGLSSFMVENKYYLLTKEEVGNLFLRYLTIAFKDTLDFISDISDKWNKSSKMEVEHTLDCGTLIKTNVELRGSDFYIIISANNKEKHCELNIKLKDINDPYDIIKDKEIDLDNIYVKNVIGLLDKL